MFLDSIYFFKSPSTLFLVQVGINDDHWLTSSNPVDFHQSKSVDEPTADRSFETISCF